MVKRLEKNSPCLGDCDSLCLNYCIISVSWTATFPNYPRPNGRINQTIPKFWKSTLQTVQEFMAKTPFAKDLESANESINQLWGKLANSFKDFAGITYKQAHKVWEASFLQSLLLS